MMIPTIPMLTARLLRAGDRAFDGADVLAPLRRWLDGADVANPQVARTICKLIPSQCPFARTIRWGDRTLLTIPPLCKLNPLYDQLINLRFRALCYLADECQEDVTAWL